MESDVRVRASFGEMDRFFERGDEYSEKVSILVKFVERVDGGWWRVIVRHSEPAKSLDGRKYGSIAGLVAALEREVDRCEGGGHGYE